LIGNNKISILFTVLLAAICEMSLSQTNELFEAENAVLLGTTEIVTCSNASGGKMVKGLSSGEANAVLFDDINLDESGEFFVTVSYYSTSARNIIYELNDNGSVSQSIPARSAVQ